MNCPIAGCETEIHSGIVMCRPHWFQVPKEIRQEVWSAWRAREKAAENGDDHYHEAAQRHEHAKAAAIAAVEAR